MSGSSPVCKPKPAPRAVRYHTPVSFRPHRLQRRRQRAPQATLGGGGGAVRFRESHQVAVQEVGVKGRPVINCLKLVRRGGSRK